MDSKLAQENLARTRDEIWDLHLHAKWDGFPNRPVHVVITYTSDSDLDTDCPSIPCDDERVRYSNISSIKRTEYPYNPFRGTSVPSKGNLVNREPRRRLSPDVRSMSYATPIEVCSGRASTSSNSSHIFAQLENHIAMTANQRAASGGISSFELTDDDYRASSTGTVEIHLSPTKSSPILAKEPLFSAGTNKKGLEKQYTNEGSVQIATDDLSSQGIRSSRRQKVPNRSAYRDKVPWQSPSQSDFHSGIWTPVKTPSPAHNDSPSSKATATKSSRSSDKGSSPHSTGASSSRIEVAKKKKMLVYKPESSGPLRATSGNQYKNALDKPSTIEWSGKALVFGIEIPSPDIDEDRNLQAKSSTSPSMGIIPKPSQDIVPDSSYLEIGPGIPESWSWEHRSNRWLDRLNQCEDGSGLSIPSIPDYLLQDYPKAWFLGSRGIVMYDITIELEVSLSQPDANGWQTFLLSNFFPLKDNSDLGLYLFEMEEGFGRAEYPDAQIYTHVDGSEEITAARYVTGNFTAVEGLHLSIRLKKPLYEIPVYTMSVTLCAVAMAAGQRGTQIKYHASLIIGQPFSIFADLICYSLVIQDGPANTGHYHLGLGETSIVLPNDRPLFPDDGAEWTGKEIRIYRDASDIELPLELHFTLTYQEKFPTTIMIPHFHPSEGAVISEKVIVIQRQSNLLIEHVPKDNLSNWKAVRLDGESLKEVVRLNGEEPKGILFCRIETPRTFPLEFIDGIKVKISQLENVAFISAHGRLLLHTLPELYYNVEFIIEKINGQLDCRMTKAVHSTEMSRSQREIHSIKESSRSGGEHSGFLLDGLDLIGPMSWPEVGKDIRDLSDESVARVHKGDDIAELQLLQSSASTNGERRFPWQFGRLCLASQGSFWMRVMFYGITIGYILILSYVVIQIRERLMKIPAWAETINKVSISCYDCSTTADAASVTTRTAMTPHDIFQEKSRRIAALESELEIAFSGHGTFLSKDEIGTAGLADSVQSRSDAKVAEVFHAEDRQSQSTEKTARDWVDRALGWRPVY